MRRLLVPLFASLALASVAAAGTPLRLMTYNIRLHVDSDGVNAWPYRKAWVVAQVEWLHPDLFGMQEVLPGQKSDLIAALPGYRFFGGGRDDGKDKGEASPLAYDPQRFDFVEGGLFWLSPTPERPSKGWDAALPRIATWARLRVRGTREDVLAINTHWDHVGDIARREAAAQMVRWIGANARHCEHVLYLGDFNSGIDTPQMRALLASPLGLRNARAVTKTPPFGPPGTFNDFQTAPRDDIAIDHVLVGRDVDVERYAVFTQVIDGRVPSDHFPVLVDVTLGTCR